MVPMVNTISLLFTEFHNIFLTNISFQFLADKLLNKRRIKKQIGFHVSIFIFRLHDMRFFIVTICCKELLFSDM